MPDLIRHPEPKEHWIPAFAGMTILEKSGS
jgi:hypothetical protein